MGRELDDLAAFLASPDGQAQKTPVDRNYEIFMGLGVVKTVNGDGTVAITYNGGNGDGTNSGAGPGLPAGCLGNYAPKVGDTVLVFILGSQLWVTNVQGPPGWTDFTPGWTGATSDPAIGNGTLKGRYKLLSPKTCAVWIFLLTGSTTTFGSGLWTFGLPFPCSPIGSQVGSGIMNNGNLYPVTWVANFGATGSAMYAPSSNSLTTLIQLQSGAYFSASGQFLLANMIYEIA